jgi:hypothetical protein
MPISIRRHPLGTSIAMLVTILALIGAGLWIAKDRAGATTNDYIVYNQQSGNKGTYLQYVDGTTGTKTTQSITGNAGCATSSQLSNPVLAFTAFFYGHGYTDPSGAFLAPTATASAGQFNNRTGVCSVPQAWSIEAGEGLDFGVGANNSLTAGRVFVQAQIPVEREDKGTALLQARLVEKLNGNVVAYTPFTIPAASSNVAPQVMADTNSPATVSTTNPATSPPLASGFDTVEVQMVSPSTGSISVVGPTTQFPPPKFIFAGEICGGQTITTTSSDGTLTTGQITAKFTLDAPSTVCKSYTFLDASVTQGQITFLSQQVAGLHVTASFDWGNRPACSASPTTEGSITTECAPTQVDVGDGTGLHDQTFCDPTNHTAASVQAGAPPWCTTSRDVEYVSDPANPTVTVTHITETWDGYGDVIWRN